MAIITSNQVCNICCLHYNAGLRCCALGSLIEGGYLYAKCGRQAWIVACSSREVSRTWYCRADAVTVAEASNACGDWFVPGRIDLILGHTCKSFWDSFSSVSYYSNTECVSNRAWDVNFSSGNVGNNTGYKTNTNCVRAFRRVFY